MQDVSAVFRRRVCASMCARRQVYMCACMCIGARVCLDVRTCTGVCVVSKCVHICANVCAHVQVCLCVCVHAHTCACLPPRSAGNRTLSMIMGCL